MQLFNNVLPLLMLASGAIAEVYIISFENLETPDSHYNKIKKIITTKFEGKIKTEYTIIRGFTADIPNVSVFTLEDELHDSKYPVTIEKDSKVSING